MKHFELQCPGRPEAVLEAFILSDSVRYGLVDDRPAVLVLPGGGYVYCCDREAEPVAMAYLNSGFHAFVLRYSTGWDAAGFAPLAEVSWVIGLMRENAEQWHIAKEKIAVCGFSAGGHLALSSGLLAENKPNAMILGYPVASTPNVPGMDFMLKVLTGKKQPTGEDAVQFDLVPQITKNAPPVFLMATAEDLLTGYGALPIAKAYSDLGMPYELHVFQYGEHGYSLANAAAADGSSRKLDEAFAQWHPLSVLWLNRIFGKPEFQDSDVGKMMQYVNAL